MPIPTSMLGDGERLVVSTRTHAKALIAPLLVLVLLLALGVTAQVLVDQRILTWIVWGLVALGVLRWTVWPALQWLTGWYAITTRRLVTRTGVITRRGHDIPLARISDVATERDLIDRMLGCGTLVISDASTFGSVPLPDIPKVEEVQRRLNDLLHQLHGGRGDEGA